MKKSIFLAGALLTSVSLSAQDHSYFAGVEFTNFDSEIKGTAVANGNSLSLTDSDKDNNFGIKFGIDNIANGRTYLKYGELYNKDGIEYKSLSVNYDYYITKYKILTPFIGGGIGYGDLQWSAFGASASDKGVEYGVRLGTLIDITKNANIEIAYNYLKTSANAKYVEASTGDSLSMEGQNSKGLSIGFNYKF